MKKSRYNHYFEKNEFSYFYNALNHSYFRIEKVLGSKIQEVLEDPDSLRTEYPFLYDKFLNSGFIIDDEVDELSIVRKLHHAAVESKDAHLIILSTLNCNYACWYCVQTHVGARMSDEIIERVKKAIWRLVVVDKVRSLHLDWFGGEPFMYFEEVIFPISSYAKSLCNKEGVTFFNSATSNAYYLTEDIIPKLRLIDLNSFQITIDGNRINHNKVKSMPDLDSSFDLALNHINAILASDSSASIMLRINYTHETLTNDVVDDVCRLIDKSNRSRITILTRKVWQEKAEKQFSNQLFKITDAFRKEGFPVEIWAPMTDFYNCYANRRYCVTINPAGHLVKCTSSDDLYDKNPNGIITSDGKFSWNKQYEESYLAPTFENDLCLNCNKLPSCMGNCPDKLIKEESGCKFKGLDISFSESIIHYIDEMYRYREP